MRPDAKASIILARYRLCDSCLGRQFSQAFPGKDNGQIGLEIRKGLGEAAPAETDVAECHICSGVRPALSNLEEQVPRRLEGIDFTSFLVGVSIPDAVVDREDELRMRFSLIDSESIRREFSRETGRRLEKSLGSQTDFEKPDVTILFNLSSEPPRLELQINPLFILGRYNKLERGVSQTDRFCPSCEGKGCELCFFTGYESADTVESSISKPIVSAFEGVDWRFHGAGREDIDARMLGTGRPFVVEVLSPRKRNADLAAIERDINSERDGVIKVRDLRESSRREMQHLKTKKFDKSYEVRFSFAGEIPEGAITELPHTLSGCEVRQRTPVRVMPRRKDTTRRRLVKEVHVLDVDSESATATIRVRTESGLYVKELFTGDGDRTQPNVKDLIGAESVEVISLDVVRVHDDL